MQIDLVTYPVQEIELSDLVKKDKIFKLASFVQKTKRLEKY